MCSFSYHNHTTTEQLSALVFFIRSAPLPSQPTPNAHYNGGRAQHCLVGCHRTETDFFKKVSLLPSCTESPFFPTTHNTRFPLAHSPNRLTVEDPPLLLLLAKRERRPSHCPSLLLLLLHRRRNTEREKRSVRFMRPSPLFLSKAFG